MQLLRSNTRSCAMVFLIYSMLHWSSLGQSARPVELDNIRPTTARSCEPSAEVQCRQFQATASSHEGKLLESTNKVEDVKLAIPTTVAESVQSQQESDPTQQNGTVNPQAVVNPSSEKAARLMQLYLDMHWHLAVCINPIIGVIGLAGNIISSMILVKSGLDKTSNIFLLGLAVADSCCLMGAINVADIIRFNPAARNVPFGYFIWTFAWKESYICYVFSATCVVVSSFGSCVSAATCTLITIERLLAVYLPLNFTNILTPRRARIACIGSFLFWVPYCVYMGAEVLAFTHFYSYNWGTYYSQRTVNPNSLGVYKDLDYYFATTCGKHIPLIVVTVGSILISIKVSITIRNRKKMANTNSKTSNSRTTITLLLVCVVFSITKILVLPTYALDLNDPIDQINGYILGSWLETADYINSSCNFFIYVIFNNKFRTILREMISGKCNLKLCGVNEETFAK